MGPPRIKHVSYMVNERREIKEHIASHDSFPVDPDYTLTTTSWAQIRAKFASNQVPPPPTKPPLADPPLSVAFPYSRARRLEPYVPDPPTPKYRGTGDTEMTDDDDDDDDDNGNVSDAGSTKSQWFTRPFVTVSWTQSLDGQIAVTRPISRSHVGIGNGPRAPALPGPSTPKAMTHFLRSRYDAVLVGVGTAVADDPALDCRLEIEMGGGHQPRPVILDPFLRWEITTETAVIRRAREGLGLPPWILHIAPLAPDPALVAIVEAVGGRYLPLALTRIGGQTEEVRRKQHGGTRYLLEWASILGLLTDRAIKSVLVEGGGRIINDLLSLANRGVHVLDSLLVTIAPVFFGDGGVSVCPTRPYVMDETMRIVPGPRLADVAWMPMGEDMVMCGRVMR